MGRSIAWVLVVLVGSCSREETPAPAPAASASNAPACDEVPSLFLSFQKGLDAPYYADSRNDTPQNRARDARSYQEIAGRSAALCRSLAPDMMTALIACLKEPDAVKQRIAQDADFKKRCGGPLSLFGNRLDEHSAPAELRDKAKATTTLSKEQLEAATGASTGPTTPSPAEPQAANPAVRAQAAASSQRGTIEAKLGKPTQPGHWFGIAPAVGTAPAQCWHLIVIENWNERLSAPEIVTRLERTDDEDCWVW